MELNKKIILGTVQFGLHYGVNNISKKPSKNDVFEILDYAHNTGIESLDTADAYGNASILIGEYSKENPNRFLINTKFTSSSTSVKEQLNSSLKTLALTSVNCYFFHSFDDFVNNPKILAEIISLKNESLVKKVGLSIYTNEEFSAAINNQHIDVIQIPFNLLDNYSKKGDLLKKAKDYGKEIQARSIFLQGLFFKQPSSFPSKLSPLKNYIEDLIKISEEHGYSIEEMAFKYAISQQNVDKILIGVDNIAQLIKNLNFSNKPISSNLCEVINNICVKEEHLLYPKNWN